MEHVNGWCFRGIYNGGLWENDLHVSARIHPQMSITWRTPRKNAIKVKDKNKTDSKKGIKVHGFSVLYSRKESEDKNSSCQFIV